MEQKKSKGPSGAPGISEYWAAGGPLWINFANSKVLAKKGMPDVTSSPEALRWWLGIMGLPTLRDLGSADVAFASRLRDSLVQVFDCVDQGKALSSEDLALFNSVLQMQHEWQELNQLHQGGFVSRIMRSTESIEQALGPAVESLTETLVHGDLTRLRTCAHSDCELRFYDDSKNGARRWCTMSGCGNRAKAAAFLDRKKSKG